MSIDSKIYKICDHRIFEEEVQIDDDLKTIRIPRTVTSSTLLFYINGFLTDRDNPVSSWAVENDERAVFQGRQKIVFKKNSKSSNDFYQIN